MKSAERKIKTYSVFILAMLFVLIPELSLATNYSSSNFQVMDPSIDAGQSSSSSGAFSANASLSQPAIGKSSSSGFQLWSGFQYFFKANPNVLTATPGDAQVVLSWTVPATFLGVSVASYDVGTGTSSGNYVFQNVGNVTNFTVTSLTNGTPYFFRVRAKSAGGVVLTQSNEATATPVASYPTPYPTPGGGGGGGGGGGIYPTPSNGTGVNLSGRAYPLSNVVVLKDGQIITSTIAGPDANFQVSVTNLSAGSYNFGVYGTDSKGRRSTMFTFPVMVTDGTATTISGIFLAPTIEVDKSEVKRGDNIAIFGQSVPASNITVAVHSNDFFGNTAAATDGSYLYNFDTTPLVLGQHNTQSKSAISNQISEFGSLVAFSVGTKNLANKTGACGGKGDLNNDCRVNLVDFSIAAYWYKRPLSPAFAAVEQNQLNGDGKIDLVDFSIMAYFWTG